ncbi:hypothetical protein A7U43_18400 [Mycobacterium adipatum]|uniref:Uncharacterized protein n=2 Tax=Mycobacterium adipatum TaxID=1682113 RepID=A0A172UPZ3_9MYCO|nr:hypothetical protein A7U43_18400 [Mycobacterium adipatum]
MGLPGVLRSNEVAATMLGVLLGGILSWLVALQGTNSQAEQNRDAIAAQKEQTRLAIEAQTAQADRENRAAVYGDFLTAAQKWADKREQQIFCNCIPPLELFDVYSDLRLKDLNVGIFGTDGARAASQDVVRAIPDTWLNNPNGGKVDSSKKLDLHTYAQAVSEFIHVMCAELPPEPNRRCSS